MFPRDSTDIGQRVIVLVFTYQFLTDIFIRERWIVLFDYEGANRFFTSFENQISEVIDDLFLGFINFGRIIKVYGITELKFNPADTRFVVLRVNTFGGLA